MLLAPIAVKKTIDEKREYIRDNIRQFVALRGAESSSPKLWHTRTCIFRNLCEGLSICQEETSEEIATVILHDGGAIQLRDKRNPIP